MKGIIVAYPIKETALQLKNVLESEGLYVSHVCATGASVLKIAADLRGGVIVCSSLLKDMNAATLAETLPANFDIVSITKNGKQSYMGNLISFPLPLDREEFVSTVAVLVSSQSSFTYRDKNDDDVISTAKSILMSTQKMSELQAHKYLQNESMRKGKKITDIARKIISDMAE